MNMRSLAFRLTSLTAMAVLGSILAGADLVGGAENTAKVKGSKAIGTVPSTVNTTGARLDVKGLSRAIDQLIEQRLKSDGVTPSPRSSDAEFLRRAYLDITGKIPTNTKAQEFLDSNDPTKRSKLIDELLASSDYGRHQADIWQALMLPKNSDNRRLQSEPLVSWLEKKFNANTPWNQLVSELVTAEGAQNENGAVTYFVANGTVDKVTDNVARLFLGVRLECAQCHNHPFTEWKQDEYWHMAAFFMKVQSGNVNKAAKTGNSPTVMEAAAPRRGKNALPESAKMLPPKFLLGEQPKVDTSKPYRPVLASWMTSASNPFFARAIVNRTWAQYFGRGLVNPVDDMHEGNPSSHPELLQELTRQLVANDFDLKYLVRAICNSEAYQRSSKPYGNNKDAGPELFSHMAVKVLSPEQMFDSFALVMGSETQGAGKNRPANRGGPNTPRAAFIAFFNLDDNNPLEYQAGIPQTLRLMNAPQINQAARNHSLIRDAKDPKSTLEQIYLTTLARRPTEAEMTRLLAYIEQNKSETKAAYGDIFWAIMNSSEFSMNR